MSVGDYLAGVGFAVAIWGGAVMVAVTVVRRRLAHLTGVPRVLAGALVGLAALIAAHLVPGTAGLLSRESVALVSIAGALAAWRFVPALPSAGAASGARQAPREPLPSLAPGALAAGVVALFALGAFVRLAATAPDQVDALSFGLPGIAEWIRTGSTLDVGAFFPLFEVRTYPNNGDVVYLASVLPFGNDSFVRFPALPLLAMTGLGVYGIGRELRAPAGTAALVAALVLAVPAVGEPALQDIKPDVFMYATFAAGLLFLLRHARTGALTDLLLAGAGLGLAFGARWYGISSVIAVLAVWAAARLVAGRGARRVVREGAILAGAVLVGGGYWLLRNALLTGNPVFPVDVSPFGISIFGAPHNVFAEGLGASIADRLGMPGLFSDYVLPEFGDRLGAPAVLLAAGAAVALALGLFRLRRQRRPFPPRAVALAAAAIVLAVVYAITPASAQGFADVPLRGFIGANTRWLVPALVAAAGSTAWLLGRLGRGRAVAEAAGFIAVVWGAQDTYSVRLRDIALAALLLAVAGGGYLLLARRLREMAAPARTRTAAAAAAAATLALLLVGQLDQRRYNERRFVGVSAVSDWIRANAPAGHDVGFAGGWRAGYVPIYSAFGPSYGNDVSYVASTADGPVRRYRRPSSFRRALRAGGYDLLVVGRTAFPRLDRPRPLRTYADPPEARWARAAGFREVAREDQFVLLASPRVAAPGS